MTTPGGAGVEITRDGSAELRHPRRFVRTAIHDLKNSGELTRRLLGHSLRARYRQSVLGYVWLVVTPLATAGVWLFLQSARIVHFDDTGMPYPAFVITGVFLWASFLKMLNAPLQQLSSSRHLLAKIKFPWESLVVAGWIEALLEILIYLVILALVYAYFGIPLTGILAAGPAVAALLLLGAAAGLILAPFGVIFEDVPRSLGVATFLLFFLTPVVYPPPQTMPGALTSLANPVGILLVTGREIMASLPPSHPLLALGSGIGAVIILVLGWLMFRLSAPHLVSKL